MKKLDFHAAPKTAGTADFTTFEGEPLNRSRLRGKWVLVNFWATWCAPCRKEMPMLSALQEELGGDGFEVVTIATARNPPQAMETFFEEIGVTNLPLHRDPRSELAREMAVLGLPDDGDPRTRRVRKSHGFRAMRIGPRTAPRRCFRR